MEVTVVPIVINVLGTIPKGLKSQKSEEEPRPSDYSIIKIGQNIEKSPGDLWRLAVTQTPVKDPQLTLM